ncbi:galactose mutarotase [Chitinophagaceae bacterium 26-R-25]|nr:galactose mutarotase [Chitinophagaceae bacterium 26-R-25]
MNIAKEKWGCIDGKEVGLFRLSNDKGLEVSVTSYGATIVSILMPDKNGVTENIVLGYKDLQGYIADTFYLGATVGRVANRINKGRLPVNGKVYQLPVNEPSNDCHLHGGKTGFNKHVFSVVEEIVKENVVGISLEHNSPHMEEGYPGNLTLKVTFTVNNNNELLIDYRALADADTHVNPTNHSYFNLSGGKRNGAAQQLLINASSVLETTTHYIPTGRINNVEGTRHDFSTIRKINQQEEIMFNECYVLNAPEMKVCSAELFDAPSGRAMQVYTTVPGMMFYSGDQLNNGFTACGGVCLETQFFPDAANHPCFANTLLKAGEEFHHQTKLVFVLR